MFSCDLYEYCQKNLFIEHLQVTASEYSIIIFKFLCAPKMDGVGWGHWDIF